ncbi:MAG: GDSL family lipase [Chloroflexi bacterium]|nr:GDSL family lipase [Chloroflexota bacterium]
MDPTERMEVRPSDERLRWHGAISLQHTAEWSQPWRLPHEDLALFPPEALVERAAMPAGVRLAFRSATTTVQGTIEPQPEMAPVDLCVDGRIVASQPMAGQEAFAFDDLPAGEKLIELWLPQFGTFRLRSLALSAGATLAPAEDARPRWVTYGSSITQCRAAVSPTQTWPAIVARERGLHLTCLGYGGQCHLDPMVARLIRDLPAGYLSMCVGINIYGAASLNPRTFQPAIIGFVQIVRERHRDTPFVVMSPIYSPPRETTKNAVGFTLQAMREEVALAVGALRSRGDRNVHYVDGTAVFGPEYAHLLPDQLHPDAEGYRVMGRNFARQVAGRYFV